MWIYYDEYLDLHRYYDTLLQKVKKEGFLDFDKISTDEWKQLAVVEHAGQGMLVDLFGKTERQISDRRKKVIGSVKYDFCSFDRLIKLYIVTRISSLNSIQILEQLSSKGFKEVYEINYENKMLYKKKFNILEEINHQQEILVYNLANPNNKKETLDDILIKIMNSMYHNGELSLDYLDYEFYPNRDVILKAVELELKKYNKTKQEENTVFVKLENFKNHESKPSKTKRTGGKKDYIKQYINQQNSGTTGEDFAYEQEQKRLKDYPELLEKIIPYYKTEPAIGFDILSYETDGTEKHIEVKSSSTNKSDKKIHFFISDNEDEQLRKDPNACIYYVYNFSNKKIKEIKREQYLEMKKTPRLFEVDIDCE